jgi:uncharacterized protein YbjT (DUF2867 family)
MVLVVGATGLLGSEVVRRLASRGERVRALVRTTANPERLESIRQAGAELVFGDLKDPATLLAACRGADAIIATASSTLSRQPGDDISSVDRDGYLHLIDAAIHAGISRFIYISIPPEIRSSPLSEAKARVGSKLMESGMSYTILAANFFMEVWLGAALGFDVHAGRVRIYGTGENPIGFVSFKDVAEIAVRSLREERSQNCTLAVAGPANIAPIEVVRKFERAIGHPFDIDFVSEEALLHQWHNAKDPLDMSFAAIMLEYARGCPMDVRDTLAVLPISLTSIDEFVEAVSTEKLTKA